MHNHPIITKVLTLDFNFNKKVLKTIPLCIKIPNLSLNCWSKDVLSRISSELGRPLYADNYITTTKSISYAQIIVDIDITRPLPNGIKVCDPNGKAIELTKL